MTPRRWPLVVALFTRAWRHRFEPGDRVVRVCGWRSCLLDAHGYRRQHVCFCLRLFGRHW